MITAVFLDFYGTLVRWHPPAEAIQHSASAAEGVATNEDAIAAAYPSANAFMDQENARSPIAGRGDEARARFFAEYERRLLAASGVDVSDAAAKRVWDRVNAASKELVLFEDAIAALGELRSAGLSVGVISNMGLELGELLHRLGITAYASVLATSAEAGAGKPERPIFQLALEKAGVEPAEAVHVGDSYDADVVGARGAGLHTLFLDRTGMNPAPDGSPTVATLREVLPLLRDRALIA